MPLRSLIDGKEVIAPLLDEDEWNRLKEAVRSKESVILLPCCQRSGFFRTSQLGTHHFVHKRKLDCDWKPETAEHLKIKSETVVACKNAGYGVSSEVSGSDWRADVLATKGSRKIAFEVQWSAQTLEETLDRQERYRRDGVRGCWLFRKIPNGLYDAPYEQIDALIEAGKVVFGPPIGRKDLPLFELFWNSSTSLPFIIVNGFVARRLWQTNGFLC